MKNKLPNLEYKGYKGVFKFESKKNGFECRIYSPANPGEPLEYPRFYDNTKKGLHRGVKECVDAIIEREIFSKKNAEWLSVTDYISVSCVYNILPEEFERRIKNNKFDKTLLQSVKGWDYEVPLYYITKAYDVLLKDSMVQDDLKLFSEEEYDDDEKDETIVVRPFADTLKVHAEMKKLWKELFDIDIDNLEVDFSQFNKHLPPNITEDESFDYFHDVPEGLSDWILEGMLYPVLNECLINRFVNRVSCLMEYTARVLYEWETFN